MNSKLMMKGQKALEGLVKFEIDKPITDMNEVRELLDVIEALDLLRRDTVKDESFDDISF